MPRPAPATCGGVASWVPAVQSLPSLGSASRGRHSDGRSLAVVAVGAAIALAAVGAASSATVRAQSGLDWTSVGPALADHDGWGVRGGRARLGGRNGASPRGLGRLGSRRHRAAAHRRCTGRRLSGSAARMTRRSSTRTCGAWSTGRLPASSPRTCRDQVRQANVCWCRRPNSHRPAAGHRARTSWTCWSVGGS